MAINKVDIQKSTASTGQGSTPFGLIQSRNTLDCRFIQLFDREMRLFERDITGTCFDRKQKLDQINFSCEDKNLEESNSYSCYGVVQTGMVVLMIIHPLYCKQAWFWIQSCKYISTF